MTPELYSTLKAVNRRAGWFTVADIAQDLTVLNSVAYGRLLQLHKSWRAVERIKTGRNCTYYLTEVGAKLLATPRTELTTIQRKLHTKAGILAYMSANPGATTAAMLVAAGVGKMNTLYTSLTRLVSEGKITEVGTGARGAKAYALQGQLQAMPAKHDAMDRVTAQSNYWRAWMSSPCHPVTGRDV